MVVLGVGSLALAGPAAAADCVALVVDSGSGPRTGCVTWSGDLRGVDVLTRTGHTITFRPTDGLICRIDNVPATCKADSTHYWSYWHRGAGSSAWVYSSEGAATYHPARNATEGWAYQDGSSRQPANIAFATICPQAVTPPPASPRPPARPPTKPGAPPASTPATTARPPAGAPPTSVHPPGVPHTGAAPPTVPAGRGRPATPPRTPATTTAATATTVPGSTPSATPPTTASPSAAATTGPPDSGGGTPLPAIIGVVLVAALAGTGAWYARTRRAREP
jgi:hypothetical protein